MPSMSFWDHVYASRVPMWLIQAIVYAVGLGLSIMFAAAVAYLIVEEFETRRPPK